MMHVLRLHLVIDEYDYYKFVCALYIECDLELLVQEIVFMVEVILEYCLGVVVETIRTKVEPGKFPVQPTKRLKSCEMWRLEK